MDSEIKKLTIFIPLNMELELDTAKRERYREGTQNEMINDLIARGLASLKMCAGEDYKV